MTPSFSKRRSPPSRNAVVSAGRLTLATRCVTRNGTALRFRLPVWSPSTNCPRMLSSRFRMTPRTLLVVPTQGCTKLPFASPVCRSRLNSILALFGSVTLIVFVMVSLTRFVMPSARSASAIVARPFAQCNTRVSLGGAVYGEARNATSLEKPAG